MNNTNLVRQVLIAFAGFTIIALIGCKNLAKPQPDPQSAIYTTTLNEGGEGSAASPAKLRKVNQ